MLKKINIIYIISDRKNMEHQDFKPVVLRKNYVLTSGNNKAISISDSERRFIKYEKKEDGQVVVPKTFTKEFGQRLATARVSKNMNRKDLSLKLNVKESVVADMENGKLLYDGNLVHKLKRIFPDL